MSRVLAGLAVLVVAVIAAIVSFSHIESLALGHGQPIWDARLLPVSVDGLLVVSSLTMLAEARAQRPAPGLARFGLVFGIAGTLAANVAYGVHFGLVGAVISAWPAAAFVTATEIVLVGLRRAGGIPTRDATAETVAGTVSGDVHEDVPSVVPVDVPEVEPVAVTASTVPPAPVATARTVASSRARRHALGRASKAPERIFAAEIERGELPSLRTIKTRAKCGTDRARTIRDQLAAILEEAPEAA